MLRFKQAPGIIGIDRSYKKIKTSDYLKDYVDVERFIECCKMCPNYGNKWACPPYPFDVRDEYWNKYDYLHLFAFKMYVDESICSSEMTEDEIDKLIMGIRHQNYVLVSKWILDMEKNNPGSMALDGGHCSKCKHCTKPKGKPCRHEAYIRPAIDAIGGDLCKTAEDIFKTKILWINKGKVPEYFLFIVGLLSDEEVISMQ